MTTPTPNRDPGPRLVPAVITPVPRDRALSIMLFLTGMSLLGIAALPFVLFVSAARTDRPVAGATPAVVVTVERTQPAPTVGPTAVAVAPVPAPAELAFIETRGGTSYVVLGELPSVRAEDDTEPGLSRSFRAVELGTPRLLGTLEQVEGAVADITGRVPAEAAAWRGPVVTETGCRARVTRFVALAPAIGSSFYMPIEHQASATDAAANLIELGPVYLAAALDGCDGLFARRQAAPAPLVPTPVDDADVAAAARDRLLSSALAARADAAWREAEMKGDWRTDDWTEISVQIVRHPRSGDRVVSVLAHSDAGCGGADIRLWAVYDLTDDDKLRERWTVVPEQLFILDAVVDVDDDGRFEWIGRGQLGDRLLIGSDGDQPVTREVLEIPFYGCPC